MIFADSLAGGIAVQDASAVLYVATSWGAHSPVDYRLAREGRCTRSAAEFYGRVTGCQGLLLDLYRRSKSAGEALASKPHDKAHTLTLMLPATYTENYPKNTRRMRL